MSKLLLPSVKQIIEDNNAKEESRVKAAESYEVEQNIGYINEGTESSESTENPEIIEPLVTKKIIDIEDMAATLVEVASQRLDYRTQMNLIEDRKKLMMTLFVGLAREINGPGSDHVISMLENLDTTQFSRQMVTERNQLANGIIALAQSLNFKFEVFEEHTKRAIVIDYNIASNTFLLMRIIVQLTADVQNIYKENEKLKNELTNQSRNILRYTDKAGELETIIRTKDEELLSLHKIAGTVARFPLRGMPPGMPCWVIRHKSEPDTFIGLTAASKKRKYRTILDYHAVKGLSAAYTIKSGPDLPADRAPLEFRTLMEEFYLRKHYQFFDPDDYEIEKLTTQRFGQ